MANYQAAPRQKSRETNARKRSIAAQLGVKVSQLKKLSNGEYIADVPMPGAPKVAKRAAHIFLEKPLATPKKKHAKKKHAKKKHAKKKHAKNTNPVNGRRARTQKQSPSMPTSKVALRNKDKQERAYVAKIVSEADTNLALRLAETMVEVLRRQQRG